MAAKPLSLKQSLVSAGVSVYDGPSTTKKPKAKPKSKPKPKPKGGGAGSGDPYAKAAKAAEDRARKSNNQSATQSAKSAIEQLNDTIEAKRRQRDINKDSDAALKRLTGGGLKSALDVELGNISRNSATKMDQINRTFESSLSSFNESRKDNAASEGDSSFGNLLNRARESTDLAGQTANLGAGESDTLQTQLQAVRNWTANQSEVNRSFFDTQTSINSGVIDLNNVTRTSKINEEQAANSARANAYNDFYSSMSETYGKRAELAGQNYLLNGEITAAKNAKKSSESVLRWMGRGKDYEDYVVSVPKEYRPKPKGKAAKPPTITGGTGSTNHPEAKKASSSSGRDEWTTNLNDKAADYATRQWKDPGVSNATKNWTGAATVNTRLTSSVVAQTPARRKRPEGSTLRSW